MQGSKKFDVIVIGGGAGGGTVATTLATNKKLKIAMVERNKLGGTCLNYGCDPTKTLIQIAKLLHSSKDAGKYGLNLTFSSFDWDKVLDRVHQVQRQMLGGTQEQAAQNMRDMGVEFFWGEARFNSPHQLVISQAGGELQIEADQIVIATGTSSAKLPIKGLEQAGFITNIEAVQLSELPKRMAIIGGGPIGIEFSQLFRRYGVEVTVLEHNSTVLFTEDQDLARELCKVLKNEGIRIYTKVSIQKVEVGSGGKKIFFQCDGASTEEILVDEILVAAGRVPNIESLDLDSVGVKTNEDGIIVDKYLQTNIPNIWAIGDVTGGYQFTHVANYQGEIVSNNLTNQQRQTYEDNNIPWVTYTDPELAHIGKTEEQLQKHKIDYRVLRFPMKNVERALINDEVVGEVKLLVGQDDKILGGHILAASAGELLAPIVLAIQAGISVDQLASLIFPYPTLSEAIKQVATQK